MNWNIPVDVVVSVEVKKIKMFIRKKLDDRTCIMLIPEAEFLNLK